MARYKTAKDNPAYKRRRTTPRPSMSGEGYGTNRGSSRYKFEIRIFHNRATKKIAEAKRSLSREIEAITKEFLDATGTPGVRRSNLISFESKPKKTSVGKSVAQINSRLDSDRFIEDLFQHYAPEVGRIGVDSIRLGIQNPEERPTSFRYETGLMYNSVRFHKRKTQDSIIIDIGWTGKFYKYFDFQERGTSGNGKGGRPIGPMNAITSGYRRTVPKAYRMMSSFLTDYTNAGGFNKRYKK